MKVTCIKMKVTMMMKVTKYAVDNDCMLYALFSSIDHSNLTISLHPSPVLA